MKKSSRAGFSKKKSVSAIFYFLGSKWALFALFATLRENGSNDFAHFAYLDRSHQYLQLLYWHHGQKKMSRPSRAPFRSKFWGLLGSKFFFWLFSKKKFFFQFFRFFSFWVQNCKKKFFSIVRSGHLRLRIFSKKVKNRNFSNSKPLYRVWVIGSVRYGIICKYKMGRSICKRPQVQKFF